MEKRVHLVGKRYGRLLVVSEMEQFGYLRKFNCLCDCGKEVVVLMSNLQKQNHTNSCGCLKKERAIKRLTTHGHVSNGKWSKEYQSWAHMISRCTNPNTNRYSIYGGRGISVDSEWMGKNGFNNFLKDMGERPSKQHSLDRKDNNGNYSKENCKWSTRIEQAQNKRNNHWEEYNGEKKVVNEWARVLGIRQNIICKRLKKYSFSEMIDKYHSNFKMELAL